MGQSVVIEILSSHHNRKGFTCGNLSLDEYLQRRASQDQKRFSSVAYVLIKKSSNKIRGYYTLSALSVDLGHLPEDLAKKLPRYPAVPATMLGRLAVAKAYQGRGYGELLLIDALKTSLNSSSKVASTGVIVDAIDANAARFYKHFGFIGLKDRKDRFYLPMKTIAQLFLDY